MPAKGHKVGSGLLGCPIGLKFHRNQVFIVENGIFNKSGVHKSLDL